MSQVTDPVILDSTGQDIVTQLAAISAAITGDSTKVDKTDLTSIQATGTVNTTGATIGVDVYFYLNGVLVRAIQDILDGAQFTLNTNYRVVTAGALNEMLKQIPVTLTQQSVYTIHKLEAYLLLGSIVMLWFDITATSASSSNTQIASIASSKPASNYVDGVTDNVASGTFIRFRYNSNGTIQIANGTNGKSYTGSVFYHV